MLRNVAAKIQLFAFDTTTGLPKTGDAANITAYVSKDGGAVTVLADTSASEIEATNAKGWYQFDLAQGETDAVDLLFTGKSSTANISVVGRPVTTAFPQTGDNFARIGAPAGASVSADIAAVKVDTAAVKVKTDFLPSATAGSAGGVFIAGSNAATSVTTALTANLIGNVTGNLSGSVGSVTADVGITQTGADKVWATAARTLTSFGTLAADVWSVATRVLTAGTNIVLAKGVGVTGFNDLDAAGIRTAVGLASANLDTQLAGISAPTAADVADAVWDEALSGHAGVGSAGAALSAAGSAGDPWSTPLPGAYGAGTAGQIVGDNIDAAITSRLATGGYTAPPTTAQVADKVLGRNLAGGSDGGRMVKDALRSLRNKTSIAGGTLTVTEEDDTTTAWTAAVTTAAGDPLTSIDPA